MTLGSLITVLVVAALAAIAWVDWKRQSVREPRIEDVVEEVEFHLSYKKYEGALQVLDEAGARFPNNERLALLRKRTIELQSADASQSQ